MILAAMALYIPAVVSWTQPEGGLFTWVTLPLSMSNDEKLEEASDCKVTFVPGAGRQR